MIAAVEAVPFVNGCHHVEPASVLQVRDVWFSYPNRRPILKGVSLGAEEGQITMVLGASGSGKTTLLKLVKGLLVPQRGEIAVLGRPIRAARSGRLDPQVAYIPQQLGLVRNLSVLDNTIVGALGHIGTMPSLLKLFPGDLIRRAHEILETLGIGHKAEEKVYSLSGGERQRVAIARALMQRPRLILADEFVSQLDPVTTGEIMNVMREIARNGVALVMTTHEMDVVDRYADRVLIFRDGEKVLDCSAREARLADLGRVMKQ